MNKQITLTSPANLITIGIAVAVLSNPLLYLMIASLVVDVQNLFGASIDRQSVSFNTNDPFIQAMSLVGATGMVTIIIGQWKRRNQK
jgi:hypothetical protein